MADERRSLKGVWDFSPPQVGNGGKDGKWLNFPFLSPSYGRRLGKVVAAAVDPIKCLQSMLCEACPPEDDHPASASDASAALVG